MFRLFYLKLKKNIHFKLSEFYSAWIVEHPIITILSYLFMFICFSFGLFQIQFLTDNNALTVIKNSDYLKSAQIIKNNFVHEPTKRYFQHQLTDLGYYAEFIVTLKHTSNGQYYNSSYNFLNETILNEYNNLYDRVFNLTITNDDLSTIRYKDLCPTRLNKCAIEGSIIRNELFQKLFINKEVKYEKHDHGSVYINADLLDGTSFDFGKIKNLIFILK